MDETLDKTSIETISLLETRLLRVENIIYGLSDAPTQPPTESVSTSLADLERRFALLVRRTRIYSEILKIYNAHPSLFQYTAPELPPTELSPEALRAMVLSYASSFPSTVSALTAVTADTPVPDAKLSAELIALMPRMKGIEATQLAQEAEIAQLRVRSEQVMRAWYEGRVLRYGQSVADAEGRFENAELGIRRLEKLREAEAAL
jgi:hypothetical protein